jgi:K+-sensing histidine kinase KdpD
VDGGKNYGGSGLGLVICKQLIEMMQGAIQVESAPGYGSVFRFHIAVKPPLQQSAASDQPEAHVRPLYQRNTAYPGGGRQ